MVTLLESVVCWFPGLSEALVEGTKGIISIIFTGLIRDRVS